MNAQDIITKLNLQPHPEGGWYRQTWVAESGGGRPTGTAIYYLLEQGQKSHWHHIDAVEFWHYYAGAPLLLSISETVKGPARVISLGPDLMAGMRPQAIVPKGHWQAAVSTGEFTLVGCTVSPAFQFEGFHLAPPDFDIPKT